MKKLLFISGFLAGSLILTAQRSIVVIGSSTAWGKGSTPGHSWVSLTSAWLKAQGLIDTIYNLAIPGYTTWDGLPAGSPHPTGSDSTDPKRNVTRALKYRPLPKMVIVSYPSNDIGDGYTVTQYLANLRSIYRTVVEAQSICFITTSQPINSKSASVRKMLQIAADSIRQEYPANSLAFYDTVANHSSGDDSLTIKAEYSFGDGLHLNDSGHLALFHQVEANADFLAALTLHVGQPVLSPISSSSIGIAWTAAHVDSPTQFFIQRGIDTLHFMDIGEVAGTASVAALQYVFTDTSEPSGLSYYRIRAVSKSGELYSGNVRHTNAARNFDIVRLYSPAGSPNLVTDIEISKSEQLYISVYDVAGRMICLQTIQVTAPETTQVIVLPGLKAGLYFIRLSDKSGQKESRAIIKF